MCVCVCSCASLSMFVLDITCHFLATKGKLLAIYRQEGYCMMIATVRLEQGCQMIVSGAFLSPSILSDINWQIHLTIIDRTLYNIIFNIMTWYYNRKWCNRKLRNNDCHMDLFTSSVLYMYMCACTFACPCSPLSINSRATYFEAADSCSYEISTTGHTYHRSWLKKFKIVRGYIKTITDYEILSTWLVMSGSLSICYGSFNFSASIKNYSINSISVIDQHSKKTQACMEFALLAQKGPR